MNYAGSAATATLPQPLTVKFGDPAWIRTRDLQLRRLLLYPLSYGAVRRAEQTRDVVLLWEPAKIKPPVRRSRRPAWLPGAIGVPGPVRGG
jgi:hypothetical protein